MSARLFLLGTLSFKELRLGGVHLTESELGIIEDAPAELPVSSRLTVGLGLEKDLKMSECSLLVLSDLLPELSSGFSSC